jgi:acyl CoA:acetate/3-ketoacid CoA transferase alpha subunit
MDVIERGLGKLIQPPDLNGFRAWNRAKPKALVDKRMTEAEAVSTLIETGDYIGTELYGTVRCPMSLVREIIRQDIKGLRMAGQGVLDTDMLLGAGLVVEMDFNYIGLEVYGVSSALRRVVEGGTITAGAEWSNGAMAWRLKAAAMGVPFIPVRSMLGTDTFKYSAAALAECPFTGDPVALLPALILDVGLIHVHRADMYGNAQIDGIQGFAAELSRASRKLIVSAEEIIDNETIRGEPDRTLIPYYLVDAVVEAPFGAHPGEMAYTYARDEEQIKAWVEASKDPQTTQEYLDTYVHGVADQAAYLDLIGREKLAGFKSQAQER